MEKSKLINFVNDVLPDFNEKFCIAGGSMVSLLLNQPINDIDIFFENEEDYNKCFDYFTNELGKSVIYESANAAKFRHYGMNYDLIKREFGNPQEIISKFDFYNCAIAATKNGVFTLSLTEESIKNMRLVLVDDNYKYNPTSSMKRVVKYAKKGFSVGSGVLELILSEVRIQKEDEFMNSWNDKSSFDF